MEFLKKILKKNHAYRLWNSYKQSQAQNKELRDVINSWNNNGRPTPPPQIFKRLVIKEYAKKKNIKIFIETGTYLGETLDYFKKYFKELISIELDQALYEGAKQKFLSCNNVKIYHGDSGDVIEEVIKSISEPCIFWLDGHYSEGFTAKGILNTPIIAELKHILNHPIDRHVILVDDARCFNGHDDYPTVDYLTDYVRKIKPEFKISVMDDIIRIHK